MPSIEYDCQCQREDCHNWTGFRVGDVYWGEGDNKTTGLWINICDSKGTDLEVLLDPYSADDLGRRLYIMTRPKKLGISYARDRTADVLLAILMTIFAMVVAGFAGWIAPEVYYEWFNPWKTVAFLLTAGIAIVSIPGLHNLWLEALEK